MEVVGYCEEGKYNVADQKHSLIVKHFSKANRSSKWALREED